MSSLDEESPSCDTPSSNIKRKDEMTRKAEKNLARNKELQETLAKDGVGFTFIEFPARFIEGNETAEVVNAPNKNGELTYRTESKIILPAKYAVAFFLEKDMLVYTAAVFHGLMKGQEGLTAESTRHGTMKLNLKGQNLAKWSKKARDQLVYTATERFVANPVRVLLNGTASTIPDIIEKEGNVVVDEKGKKRTHPALREAIKSILFDNPGLVRTLKQHRGLSEYRYSDLVSSD
jgi:hypothetical protein